MKSNRYHASEILDLLAQMPQPVAWRDLVVAADAIQPREITQLRQMLRGLERTGEIQKTAEGGYFIERLENTSAGLVEGRGRKMAVDSHPIANAQKLSLRAGDEVSYILVDGEARVQDVVAFNPDPIAGVLHWHGRKAYVEAIGTLRGRVFLPDDPDAKHGDTVSVQITGRDRRGLVGRVTAAIEGKNVLDEAISTALVAHQIPYEWPKAVSDAANKLPKSVNPKQFPKRKDLTDLALVTIDGETAKDFDDAVYATKQKEGWRLVVAIADVAHYVKMGSVLDDEAVERGTSVYFPERVVPMLPEEISNGLCSLRPKTPRLALVCDMRVNRAGNVVSHEFSEAVIYSHARLTYTQVQNFIDGKAPLPEGGQDPVAIEKSIKALSQLYKAFSKAREKRGALDFPTHEGAIQIKRGRVNAITPVQRVQAHQLIEEAMIAANVAAAEFLEECGLGGLYRVHDQPEQGRLEELRQTLAHAGVRLQPGDVTPAQLQKALMSLPSSANDWLFGQLALRTMQQAIYTPNNAGHYGLALERYMHFTSPIRRYPDLVVHRLIKHQLANKAKNKKPPRIPSPDEVQRLGELCSNNERRAESAGWMVDGWLKCDYLMDHIGETFEGTIATATDFGLFIELEGCFIQGLLHISNLGGDYYVFKAASQSLVGERNGRRFSMGDRLQVVINNIEPAQGQIDLLLPNSASSKKPATGKRESKRGEHKKDGRRKDKVSSRKKGARAKVKEDETSQKKTSQKAQKKSGNKKGKRKNKK